MTTSASLVFRATSIALAAGLGLAACSSDAYENQPGGTADNNLSAPETPAETEQEAALSDALASEDEVSETLTLADQWPDITAMASALSGTAEPDLCQEAGSAQYSLLVNAQPENVRASIDEEALIDEHATGETVTAFYGNDTAGPAQLQEAHENTDTACVAEDDATIDHETAVHDVAGEQVDVHTWQIAVSEQLTGRMIDVVGDDLYVRYAATYPPQVMLEDLDSDASEFNETATDRALSAFETAAAQ